MLRIRDLILPETHDVSELYYHAAQALHVRASDIADAAHFSAAPLTPAKRPDLRWVYTVDVTLRSGEGAVLRRCQQRKDHARGALCLTIFPAAPQRSGPWSSASARQHVRRPRAGEGGAAAPRARARRPAPLRREKVERFWSGGPLDPESNVHSARAAQARFPTASSTPARRTERGRWCFSSSCASVRGGEPLRRQTSTAGTDVLFHFIQITCGKRSARLGGRSPPSVRA